MAWHFSNKLIQDFESSHCLPDAVVGFSAEKSSDGAQSAPWNSMPIAQDDSCSAKMKDTCHHSPFGMMYVPSTDVHGEDLLTWFRGEILVREIQMLPAMVFRLRHWEINFSESSMKRNRKLYLEKILIQSDQMHLGLRSDLEMPWRILDLKPLWSRWEHVVWEVTTEKCDHGSSVYRSPCARDWKGMSAKSWRTRMDGDKTPTLPDQIGGIPHPEFVETLMLWPIGWTDSKPLETVRFQEWLHWHGEF